MQIKAIKARQILDSRGNPTVEVDVYTDAGVARAGVPSGASTGTHEALELRDDKSAYAGKGVLKAVSNVNDIIAPKLVGWDCTRQQDIDRVLQELDGTDNKSKLGANAILGVSIAVCKAGAMARYKHWYQYITDVYQAYHPKGHDTVVLPVPFMNVINGGKHAGNALAFQEFMIVPSGAHSFFEAARIGSEVYHVLKGILKDIYGLDATNVGDEGGFAPPIKTADEALDILMQAIQKSGYAGRVKLAMDAAASELYNAGMYDLEFKKPQDKTHKKVTAQKLSEMYEYMCDHYPIISIEDPFDQEDFSSHARLIKQVQSQTQIVGDDLLVTNVQRVQRAIQERSANALLLKINQIGTISEAMQAACAAHHAGWHVMVSHRSGETEDPFIADLAVGIGAGQIKAGAPCRTERTAKYNQLLRIEEHAKESGRQIRFGW